MHLHLLQTLLIDYINTVKRFFRDGDKIRFQPENDFMDPIILNERDVEIVGTVTGVFRVF